MSRGRIARGTPAVPPLMRLSRKASAFAALWLQRHFPDPRHRERIDHAACAAGPAFPTELPRILVDVSVVARFDARTGIQRVVRALAAELARLPATEAEIRFVWASRFGGYRYASLVGDHFVRHDTAVRIAPGMIFLGLDFSSYLIPRLKWRLLRWKLAGVRLVFILHDLLPVDHPEWFKPPDVTAHLEWLDTIGLLADQVICVSRTVAEQTRHWMARQRATSRSAPRIDWFHPGADIESSLPDSGGPEHLRAVADRLPNLPFLMIVGTLEPRKGHAELLDAMELLWRAPGRHVGLVIAGRPGWRVASLLERIRSHPERSGRLRWFEDLRDDGLKMVYERCLAVVVPSFAEGFGLPVVEAAQHGKPLLLRDIPVFREIAGDAATFFNAESPGSIASAIATWVDSIAHGSVPDPGRLATLTWKQSAQRLMACILR